MASIAIVGETLKRRPVPEVCRRLPRLPWETLCLVATFVPYLVRTGAERGRFSNGPNDHRRCFETRMAGLVTFGSRLVVSSADTICLLLVFNESGLADWSKLTRYASGGTWGPSGILRRTCKMVGIDRPNSAVPRMGRSERLIFQADSPLG
jgi:hypothetical protein